MACEAPCDLGFVMRELNLLADIAPFLVQFYVYLINFASEQRQWQWCFRQEAQGYLSRQLKRAWRKHRGAPIRTIVMMRRIALILCSLVIACLIVSAFVGHQIGPSLLHPAKRPLDAAQLAYVGEVVSETRATRSDFEVRATDGAILRGWKMKSAAPNGSWVLLLHGVGDNRAGTATFARFLLPAGYGVLMMDSRAQGVSGGDAVTYGWLERRDISQIISTLKASETVQHVFVLGISMGAAIALQAAGADTRIE